MASKRGTLSINSDNIFPIIKKWLYSDHDIFFRELISNGCDAITKLKKLEVMGEYTFPENHKNKVEVIVNPQDVNNVVGHKRENVEKLKDMYTLDMIVKQDEKVKPGKLELEVLEKYPEFLEDYK